MATIKSDLVGTVLATNPIYEYKSLAAGDTIPDGFWVRGDLVQGGDPADQTPPWDAPAEVSVGWADVTGKPAVIAAGATAAEARTAIGAGTSSLTLGTTATTALAGNAKATSAAAADKLTTARTVALTGAVTGSGTFDGSGNLSIATADGA